MRALATICGLAFLAATQPGTHATFADSSLSPSNGLSTLALVAPEQGEPLSAAGGAVGLSWSASAVGADVAYYVLRRPSGSAGLEVVAGPLEALSHSDDPGADGSYEYVIRAAASSFTADSAPRAAVSDGTAPSTPTASAVSGALGGAATVELSWSAAEDVTSGIAAYTVYHAEVLTLLLPCPAPGAVEYDHSVVTDGLTTALSVTTTLALTYHCFYVVGYDAVGNESAPSNVAGPTASH